MSLERALSPAAARTDGGHGIAGKNREGKGALLRFLNSCLAVSGLGCNLRALFVEASGLGRCSAARGILLPRPEIRPAPLRWERTLNHWTPRESLCCVLLVRFSLVLSAVL